MRGVSTSRVVVAVALVLAAAMATTAWAAIPDGDGAISSCYAKKGGKLRVVKAGKTCKKTERPLAWSQTGPAGAPGAKGPAGPKGAKGDAGTPSVAYATQGFEFLDADGLIVAELDLPAGKYILFGTSVVSSTATDAGEVSCLIGGPQTGLLGETHQTVPAGASVTLTAQRAIELSQRDTIGVFCSDDADTDEVGLGLALTALPVGRIVQQ